jgi:hypothetical protein
MCCDVLYSARWLCVRLREWVVPDVQVDPAGDFEPGNNSDTRTLTTVSEGNKPFHAAACA